MKFIVNVCYFAAAHGVGISYGVGSSVPGGMAPHTSLSSNSLDPKKSISQPLKTSTPISAQAKPKVREMRLFYIVFNFPLSL